MASRCPLSNVNRQFAGVHTFPRSDTAAVNAVLIISDKHEGSLVNRNLIAHADSYANRSESPQYSDGRKEHRNPFAAARSPLQIPLENHAGIQTKAGIVHEDA